MLAGADQFLLLLARLHTPGALGIAARHFCGRASPELHATARVRRRALHQPGVGGEHAPSVWREAQATESSA